MKVKYIFYITIIIFSTNCKPPNISKKNLLQPPSSGSCVIGKWDSSLLPLNIKMSSEFTGDYTSSDLVSGMNPLEQMANEWNAPVAGRVALITVPFTAANHTGHAETSSFRDNEIGIYKSNTWFSNVSANALAITQFYGTVSSHPTLGQYINFNHADIIINYRDFGADISMTNNPLFDYDLPTIVLHELGHLLGLCHESTQNSIMAPYYISTQRTLRPFDQDIISDLYVDGLITHIKRSTIGSAISSPSGTTVQGIIELLPSGLCRHFIEKNLIYEHQISL